MKKPTKAELVETIDGLKHEIQMLEDDLSFANQELIDACADRDIALQKLEELQLRVYGDRGND